MTAKANKTPDEPAAAGEPKPGTTENFPGLTGPGVESIKLADVVKCINKYERKKEIRCTASPDEIAAKRELFKVLQEHASELPKNSDGQRFYRHEERDYILKEQLLVRAADDGEE